MVSSLTKELSFACIRRVNLRADLYKMTALVQRIKDHVSRLLSAVSPELQEAYVYVVDVEKRMIQEILEEEWKKMENRFQVKPASLAISAGDKLIRRYSDFQCLSEMSSDLFSYRVMKELDLKGLKVRPPVRSIQKEHGKRLVHGVQKTC